MEKAGRVRNKQLFPWLRDEGSQIQPLAFLGAWAATHTRTPSLICTKTPNKSKEVLIGEADIHAKCLWPGSQHDQARGGISQAQPQPKGACCLSGKFTQIKILKKTELGSGSIHPCRWDTISGDAVEGMILPDW